MRPAPVRSLACLGLVAAVLAAPAGVGAAPIAPPGSASPGQETVQVPATVEGLEARIRSLEQEGDRAALAAAHNELGLLHWGEARYAPAVEHLERAQELWIELDDPASLGRVYNNLGAAHYQWGNYEAALDAFLRSRTYREEVGDLRGTTLVLTNIGRVYLDWEQFAEARSFLGEAVEVGLRSDDPFAIGYALHNLGFLELQVGAYERARDRFEESLGYYMADDERLTGSDRESGWALNTLGIASSHVQEGRPEQAIPLLEEALARSRENENVRRRVRALVELGVAFRAFGDLEAALRHLEEALALSRAVGQRTLALEAYAELAHVEEARGEPEAALAHLRAYQSLRDSIFSQSTIQRFASLEARAAAQRQERENLRLQEAQRAQQAVIARQRIVVVLGGAFLLVSTVLVILLVRYNRIGAERERQVAETNAALEERNRELQDALSEVRTLKGMIPICVHCKKVRDDRGFWEGVETYITNRSEALFSHSICTECGPQLYGEDWVPGTGAPTTEPAEGGPGPATDDADD